jgi:hypothetical protein
MERARVASLCVIPLLPPEEDVDFGRCGRARVRHDDARIDVRRGLKHGLIQRRNPFLKLKQAGLPPLILELPRKNRSSLIAAIQAHAGVSNTDLNVEASRDGRGCVLKN